MKFKLVLFIFTAVIAKCYSADDGGCGLEGPNLDWQSNLCIFDAISDVDTLNEQFTFTDTLEVTTTDNGTASSYLDIEVDQDNKILLVKTNDNFINFDNDTPTSASTEIIISVTATLKCPKGDSKLTFSIPVEDTNNNKPTFLNPTYEYSMPMPLVPKIDLTNFGDLIIAEDLDFSNKKITFTVDPSDVFQVESVATSDTKQFRTSLKVAQYQRFSEDTVVTITATDEGTPTSSSTTTVTIKVDQELSLPDIPTFKNAVYKFEYSESEGVPAVKALGDPITVTTSDATVTDVTIEDNNYVTAVFDQTTSQVSIDTTGTPIGLTTESVMLFELTVTLNKNPTDSSKTIILLEIPNDNVITVPTFSEPFYTAQYLTESDPHTIKLDEGQEISITEKEDVDITLSGDDHFSINYDTDAGKWQLNVVTNLEEDVLKKGQDIILTLEASVKDSSVSVGKGYTALVVKLPEVKVIEVPSFTQIHYSANYVVNTEEGQADTVTIEDGPITLNPTEEVVNVALDESSGNGNFKVTKEDDHWIITVTTNLAQEDLDKGGEIVLSLSATVTGQDDIQGFATLIIALPPVKQAEVPLFSQVYYTADYAVNTQGELDTVTISNGPIATEPTDALVALVDSSDNFGVALKEDHWIITVTKNLAQEDLAKGGDILLSLSAIVTGQDDNQGFATLVIALPPVAETQVPKFSEAYYTASYKVVEDHGTVELSNGPIAATSAGATVDITLKESSDNFELVLDDGTWVVNVIKDLPQDVLESGAEYVLTLEATVEGGEAVDPGESVLIITVQAPEIPVFGQPHYTAQYTVDSEKGTITITDGPITVTPSDSVTVALEDSESYSDNFNIVPNADDNTYTLEVVSNLDDATLIKEVDIVLSLKASTEGATTFGSATLVIKLPKKVAPAAFTQPYYEADYKLEEKTHSIELKNGPIDLDGDNIAETTVALTGDLKDNFAISATAPYEITLTANLDEDVLNSQHDVVITLVASLEGSSLTSSAPVIITIPDAPSPPKFTQVMYTAKYEVTDDAATVTLEDGTIATDAEDPSSVTVSVESPYDANFDLTYDDATKTYSVKVNTLLDTDVVDKQSEIYVVLDATVDRALDHSSASLVVKMPAKTSDVVPKFSEAYYTATYKHEADADDTVEIPDATSVAIVSDHASDTTVAVVDYYVANFEPTLDGDAWQLVVQQKLDDDILNNQKEIYVTLEASLTGSAEVGRTTIIMSLPTQDLKEAPRFTETYYTAEYTIDSEGTHQVTCDPISITVPADDALTKVTLQDYADNFKLTHDTDKAEWTITLDKNLDDTVLKANTELNIVLSAHLDNSKGDGTATLVVKLPKIAEEAIAFGQDIYEGAYTKSDGDNDDTVELLSEIVVTSGATVAIQTEDYKDNFAVDCQDTKCTLSVAQDLSDDILTTKSEIVLVLEASKTDVTDKGKATVIVSLPLQDVINAPEFEEVVYATTYSLDQNDKGTVTSVQIKIKGVDDVKDIEVKLSGDNEDCFTVAPKTDHWELTVANNLPQTVVDDNISILLTLTATKSGVTVSGEAGLVVNMPQKVAASEFHFETNVYMGDYSTENELSIESDIVIDGVKRDDPKIDLTGDYKDSFSAAYADQKVTITLKSPLSSDVLENNAVISVGIKATQDTDEATATLVVKLPKQQDDSEGPEFTKLTYTATYTIHKDDADEITIDDGPIQIQNVDDPSKLTLTIDDNNKEYLQIEAEEDHWKITVLKNLPLEITDDQASLVVTLTAKLEGVASPGEAALVIHLPKKVAPASFNFDSNSYLASYSLDEDGNYILTVATTITIEGDSEVDVALEGDFSKYFKATRQDSTVTITKADTLPDNIVNTESAISVDIVATKETNVTETVKATLIVKLPKSQRNGGDSDDSSDDKTGLIAAVAVLAVLLVASLVGSAVFYYLKFKRGNNYSNMDEGPRLSERFRKNSNSTDTKKIDHPTRRPTGVIKYPLNDEVVGETTTDDDPLERRKSVQFDVVNIDELEIESEMPDDDPEEIEYESMENEEENSTDL
ncbi:protocadherin Fat 3-like isoform X3 [Tenebrio molitor]|uniref:protocadherin Fat 3-like isoform X3 n=1 Tax=Tenebrio molitor TaxID=7067 RepID=UPI003624A682